MLGPSEFRDRVKIYATDVDEEALSHGPPRRLHRARDARACPTSCWRSTSSRNGGRYVFRKDLRRSVIFGRNDLVQDAPISRIDLLVCRNTLMYFNAETQAPDPLPVPLRPAPTTGCSSSARRRCCSATAPSSCRSTSSGGRSARPRGPHRPTAHCSPDVPPRGPARRARPGSTRLRDEALLAAPLAQVVVTADGLVALVNRQAEVLFGVSARDVGRPFRDLDLSYRPAGAAPSHRAGARGAAHGARSPTSSYHRGSRDDRTWRCRSARWWGESSDVLGRQRRVPRRHRARRLQDELEQANRQLETAYEELQSTNEELETTNEELQSTVEELETTNEELQSTNEELETMNEELQSHQRRAADDQRRAPGPHRRAGPGQRFLEAILTSLRAGVVVLDRELQVQVVEPPAAGAVGAAPRRRRSGSTSSTWTSACPPSGCAG